jgi:hypothetical protein
MSPALSASFNSIGTVPSTNPLAVELSKEDPNVAALAANAAKTTLQSAGCAKQRSAALAAAVTLNGLLCACVVRLVVMRCSTPTLTALKSKTLSSSSNWSGYSPLLLLLLRCKVCAHHLLHCSMGVAQVWKNLCDKYTEDKLTFPGDMMFLSGGTASQHSLAFGGLW